MICRLLLTFFLFPQVATANMESILAARTPEELAHAVTISNSERVYQRACAIQRSQGLAPTACYRVAVGMKNHEQIVRELDRECRRVASVAARVPVVDEFTSTPCRDVVQRRMLDLAYAERRDALRYP